MDLNNELLTAPPTPESHTHTHTENNKTNTISLLNDRERARTSHRHKVVRVNILRTIFVAIYYSKLSTKKMHEARNKKVNRI